MQLFAAIAVESMDDLCMSFWSMQLQLFDYFLPAVTNQLFTFLLQFLHVGFLERNSRFLCFSDVHVANRKLMMEPQSPNRIRHFIWSVAAPSCESTRPTFELLSKICIE